MNILKYGSIYSSFHGCANYRIVNPDTIVLSFADSAWDPWLIPRLHLSDKVYMSSKKPLVQALKVYFKTEAVTSVFCKRDSWTLIFGNERILIPMSEESSSTIRLYATPFFFHSPNIVDEYMKGIVLSAYNHIYPYKNCIIFLDSVDVPRPGGCYFDSTPSTSSVMYRLCILTNEPDSIVLPLIEEWTHRENKKVITFLTQDTIAVPKGIFFEPVRNWFDFSNTDIKTNGRIYKDISFKQPHCIIHDILFAYHHVISEQYKTKAINQSKDALNDEFKDLGLLLEWPLTITYEGVYDDTDNHNKQFIALTINGNQPNKVVKIERPYEKFIGFNHIPATTWQPVSFVPKVLQLPKDVFKVSIDAMVIGFIYQGSFFCFSKPLIEGVASPMTENNVNYLLSTVLNSTIQHDKRIRIIETFRLDEKYSLHHIQFTNIDQSAWCLSNAESTDAYTMQMHLPYLVREWASFFKRHVGQNLKAIHTDILKMALLLTKHDICFKIKIMDKNIPKREAVSIDESTNEIQLCMTKEEVDFVNEMRIKRNEIFITTTNDVESEEIQTDSCNIM